MFYTSVALKTFPSVKSNISEAFLKPKKLQFRPVLSYHATLNNVM